MENFEMFRNDIGRYVVYRFVKIDKKRGIVEEDDAVECYIVWIAGMYLGINQVVTCVPEKDCARPRRRLYLDRYRRLICMPIRHIFGEYQVGFWVLGFIRKCLPGKSRNK